MIVYVSIKRLAVIFTIIITKIGLKGEAFPNVVI